jgi:dipeptidyl-peptidase-3
MNSKLFKTYSIHNINFIETFEQLTEEEKNYIYYLSKACWAGQPIILFQTSFESPALFIIFQIFFSSFGELSEIKTTLLKNNISDVNYNEFLKYAALFYTNFGNYLYKKKFIPSIKSSDFEDILHLSPSFDEFKSIWDIIKYIIYDDSEKVSYINLEEKNGKNNYYFGGIKEEQIKKTDDILKKNNYSLINTRLMMLNSSKIVTLIGSIEEKQITLDEQNILFFGEYSSFLKRINNYLEDAKKYVPQDSEKEVINDYINFFNTGNIETHKESQKKWVSENLSSIDFNIGWNECVLDPMGVRGLFEGFVGIADKFLSQKYEQLVKLVKELTNELPWDENFEKKINNVQFNSLEIICFSRNGAPFGKCLPKYYEIKENYGVKNLLFFNSCPNFNSKISDYFFCDEGDIELINNLGKQSIKILTSLKQLLGYGSGKLFRITKDENNQEISNFNRDLINPITGEKIDKYYLNNETFEERFSSYASVLDEFRSLLIGLYFSENKNIQDIFYVNKSDFKNVTYTIWLLQFSRAIFGLKFYNEKDKTWGHPYIQAVYMLTKYIFEVQQEGEEIIKINLDENNDTFKIQINKYAILIYGKELLSKIMTKIHIWKCTGDVENASNFINNYSQLDEKFLKIKKIVEKNNTTVTLFLFHNLIKDEDGNISYKEYKENLLGIIESNLDRFGTEYNKDIYNQWVKYATNFIKN